MTTPQQQGQRQQKPPRKPPRLPPGSVPPAATYAIAAALAGMMLTVMTAAEIVAVLLFRFRRLRLGLFWPALLQVLGRIVLPHPPPVTGVIGAASEQVSRMNAARRAQFAVASASRVAAAMQEARSRDQDVAAAADAQIARETRYFQQHLAAMWNRAAAAGKTDMEAAVHGPLLGWNAVKDKRTSPECWAADGKNYLASAMPDIGFPGSVHPSCRCFPSAPHPGGRMLPSAGTSRARAA